MSWQRALLGAALLQGACDETRSDRPYTPFGVASVAEEAKPSPSSAPEPSSAFAPEKAVLAPVGAKEWSFKGALLKAPGSLVFEQALQADFNGDAQLEIVAWLVPDPTRKKPSSSVGELWLYDAKPSPSKLLDAPGFLPGSANCKATTQLIRTGPQTVALEIATACQPPLLGRMPTRSISVVAPGRSDPHVLTLRIASVGDASNARAQEVGFEISSLDRDGDGRDDVELRAKLTSSQAPDTEVQFVWLDRKAGLSRDALLPSKTFRDVGSIEVVRATGKTTSARTVARIEAVRRLFSALCAESRVPILLDQDNNPLPCNLSSETLGFFATAEVRAWLAQKAVGDALSALLRANWYGGAISDKTKAELTSEIEKALPVKAAYSIGSSNVAPSGPSSIPRYSPLAFDSAGQLLIQNAEGVTRLDPKTLEESDASEEVEPWPLTVISPQGKRLMGVAYPCDRSTVTLLAAHETGAATDPIDTPLLAPRPGACAPPGKGPSELVLRPIAWGTAGLSVLLGGSVVGISSGGSPPLGSARSANGEHSVTTTDLGVLVLHKTGGELWRSDEVPSRRLSECVVDNAAQHVACMDRGRARIFGVGEQPKRAAE